MGQLKSNKDWTGRLIGSTILGSPAREFPGNPNANVVATGMYIWDDPSIPDGVIDDDGDFYMEVPLNGLESI